MNKKYIVRLSDSERQTCLAVVKQLKGTSQKVRRAHILLKADADGPAWTDARIAEAYHCRVQTVENVRMSLVTEGFEVALEREEARKSADPAAAGRGEGGQADRPPLGTAARRLRPLDAPPVGRATGRTGSRGRHQPGDGAPDAKKNGMTKRKIEYWVIPPESDGEFVAHMENVLDTYAQAYDPAQPVLCMDEQPVQLIGETRVPIAATKEHPKRVDYEYERSGTASIFMFAEPLSGFRQATARPQRTKVDWATELAHLLDDALCGLRLGDAGVRQLEHAHDRSLLRSV